LKSKHFLCFPYVFCKIANWYLWTLNLFSFIETVCLSTWLIMINNSWKEISKIILQAIVSISFKFIDIEKEWTKKQITCRCRLGNVKDAQLIFKSKKEESFNFFWIKKIVSCVFVCALSWSWALFWKSSHVSLLLVKHFAILLGQTKIAAAWIFLFSIFISFSFHALTWSVLKYFLDINR
jgi:hypothetical protein